MDGGTLDINAKDKSHEIGNTVFEQEFKLYHGVESLLDSYKEKNIIYLF
jgi:hypothetical protein